MVNWTEPHGVRRDVEGVKGKDGKNGGHQRHTIKKMSLLRFEDKLEIMTPTRMNNDTLPNTPLTCVQISPVGRTIGKFSTSARKKLILL